MVENGELLSKNKVGASTGTTIAVKELFFNTPARKKHLKSNQTELAHIADIVTRYALSDKTLSIRLIVDGKESINAAGTDLLQNKIVDLVLEVERECPVGREFGRKIVPASMRVGENVCTTGEGIVFTGKFKDNYYRFKAKGKEHSASKVKTVAPIDVEKMNSIKEFVDYAVTENRLNQGVEQVFTTSSTPVEIKMMGAFLKWVSNDVITEEMDVMKESNLEPRDVKKEISNKARKWFMDYLDKLAGL